MASVYQKENFRGRVNYAAQCIVRKSGIGSRHFDTCFEMADGDAVVTALVRRAAKNPRLHEAILQYAGGTIPTSWTDAAQALAHISTRQLPYEARQQRARFHEIHGV